MEQRWPRAEKAVTSLLLIIVMVLSGATFARNRVWQDEMRLMGGCGKEKPGQCTSA